MTPEMLEQVEPLFLALVELPAGQREAELARRCPDERVRARVRELLAAHGRAEHFLDARELETPLLSLGAGVHPSAGDQLPAGAQVGDYRIRGLLGAGGMGAVYLAEQERPRRTVALKIIRRGLASASLQRRFEHEAEILGRLHHPGVAQIFEAGSAPTAPGLPPQPFIAMEYVKGPPLHLYCEQRGLRSREKMELLARVCDAVHHAHQRGVIHRDLKPGNILVDESGQPKVLDFGVARASDADLRITTLQTSAGQLIGTLPYMSPEQVLADPDEIDTRSDVYALGVILYQLLSGRLPHDLGSRSIPEASRVIREESPRRLSAVSRVFRGEVETIVARAMEKDKARRYQSAAELADDLRRHLRGEAIHAKADSALYVLRKQIRRHRWAYGGAAMGLAALVAFAAYAQVQAGVQSRLAADEHRARLEANAMRARESRASERADASAARLREELAAATIGQARLRALTGNVPVAEDVLWREVLGRADPAAALWALREVYLNQPCEWTAPVGGQPTAMALHPDGRTAVVGRGDGALLVIGTEQGRVRATLRGWSARSVSLAFDPSGRRLAVGLSDGRVAMVEDLVAALPEPGPAEHQGAVRTIAWSPDGRWMATGGDDGRVVLRSAGGPRVAAWTAHEGGLSMLAFAPDSARLLSAAMQTGATPLLRIWRVPDGSGDGAMGATPARTSAAAFTPDGAGVFTGGWDRQVRFAPFRPGESPAPIEAELGPGIVRSLSVSPDRTRLMAGFGDTVRIWRLGDREPVAKLSRHRDAIIGAGWIDDERVVSLSLDGALRSWRARSGAAATVVSGFGPWCFGVDYEPGGERYAIGSTEGRLAILDAATHRPLHRLEAGTGRNRAVRWIGEDGLLVVASEDGAVSLIDAANGSVVSAMAEARGSGEAFGIAVHPARRLVATGHADGTIHVWGVDGRGLRHERSLPRLGLRVLGLAFSPDGSTLASTGVSRGVVVWGTSSWERVRTLASDQVCWPVVFTPDGRRVIAGGFDGRIDAWDAATGVRAAKVDGHERLIAGLGLSRDGAVLATGSDDGLVKVWDASTLRELAVFPTRHNEAIAVAFDPVRSRLAAACQGDATVVWDFDLLDRWIEGNRAYQRGRVGAGEGN